MELGLQTLRLRRLSGTQWLLRRTASFGNLPRSLGRRKLEKRTKKELRAHVHPKVPDLEGQNELRTQSNLDNPF